jgi:16S rRNA (uracil1498-N3)-methyltransferase
MHRLLLPVPDPAPPSVVVGGAALHRLRHVLRLSAGDAVEVFDGRGRRFPARVERIDETSAHLALSAGLRDSPSRSVTILQGLPKGAKVEWVLEKGSELGAAAFLPVFTDRTVVKPSEGKLDARVARWRRIAEEASRQCGRADVPRVEIPRPLLEAVRGLAPGTFVCVLDEEETGRGLAEVLAACPAESPLALVVGPEGGLTRAEVSALTGAGAHPATLGALKLRTETAALVALAVVRLLDGQLG